MSFPRYEKYKDSGVEWLGEVPEHWKVYSGRRLFKNRRELADNSDQQLAASQKYGVIPQTLMMELNDSKVMLALKGTEAFRHVEKNDFVISLRSFEGGIEHSNYNGCVSPAYTVLNAKNNIHPDFYRYLFKSIAFISALQSTTDSLRDGKSITYQQFGNIDLILPSFKEQQTIAAFLDRETAKIDALIAEQQRLIELLKEKRQALISHAVTKGLNPDAPMKDSGIEWLGEVPEHWEVKPTKAIATCNDEVLPESTSDDYQIEYVEISGVNNVSGIIETNSLQFRTAPSRARRIVRDGDILVSTVRTYLRAIAPIVTPPGNMIVSTGFAVIRPRSIEPLYLGYAFQTEYLIAEIIARSVGVSYPAINASELMQLKLPFPLVNEQQAIVSFLDEKTTQLDTLTTEAQHAINLLKERRSALISAAVTGKIDVRHALNLTETPTA